MLLHFLFIIPPHELYPFFVVVFLVYSLLFFILFVHSRRLIKFYATFLSLFPSAFVILFFSTLDPLNPFLFILRAANLGFLEVFVQGFRRIKIIQSNNSSSNFCLKGLLCVCVCLGARVFVCVYSHAHLNLL